MKPAVRKLLEDINENSHKQIIVYSLSECPACMELKTRLDRLNIIYETVDMQGNDLKWKELSDIGGADYVPQVMVENNLVKDYEDINELLSKVLTEVVNRKIIIKS